MRLLFLYSSLSVSWAPPTCYNRREEMNLLVLGIVRVRWGDCIKTQEVHGKKNRYIFEKTATVH